MFKCSSEATDGPITAGLEGGLVGGREREKGGRERGRARCRYQEGKRHKLQEKEIEK